MPIDKQQLQQKITNMEAELAEMKALLNKPTPTINYWQPDINGDPFYYVTPSRSIACNYFSPYAYEDAIRYRVFQTEAEAKAYAEYIKAEETIRKAIAEANEGWWPDWTDEDQKKHTLYLNTKKNQLEVDWFTYYKRNNNFLYVKSEILAKQLANTYRQEFITYFSY